MGGGEVGTWVLGWGLFDMGDVGILGVGVFVRSTRLIWSFDTIIEHLLVVMLFDSIIIYFHSTPAWRRTSGAGV